MFEVLHNAPKSIMDNLENLIQYKLFSDNFLLYVPTTTDEKTNEFILALLIDACLNIQCHFCKCGLSLRGTITYGSLYTDKYFVFGSGLIKAVELEGTADFPIIVFDESISVPKSLSTLLPVRTFDTDKRHTDFLEYYDNRYRNTDESHKIKVMVGKHRDIILSMPNNEKLSSKRNFLINLS
jgi:hypothetical protein